MITDQAVIIIVKMALIMIWTVGFSETKINSQLMNVNIRFIAVYVQVSILKKIVQTSNSVALNNLTVLETNMPMHHHLSQLGLLMIGIVIHSMIEAIADTHMTTTITAAVAKTTMGNLNMTITLTEGIPTAIEITTETNITAMTKEHTTTTTIIQRVQRDTRTGEAVDKVIPIFNREDVILIMMTIIGPRIKTGTIIEMIWTTNI